ncbi:MAG: glycosyltransferase family 4 protein [Myxococcota bacterium]
MRIGVVTTSYPRHERDPAGSFVAGQVDWLRGQGHSVEVVCAGDPATPHTPWQAGVPIHAVYSPPGLFYRGGAPDALDARPDRLIGAAGFAARMTGAVARRAHRWQLIFAHWLIPSAAAAAVAPSPARMVGIAHSGDVHLLARLGLSDPLTALAAGRRMRLIFVADSVRRALCLGISSVRLRGYVERRSAIIPMGLDCSRFSSLKTQPQAAAPGAPARVLFLGRLVPIKGADVLLAAAIELRSYLDRELCITIAGDGPQRAELRRQAAQIDNCAIEFAGEVDTDVRDRLLAGADVIAIPSMYTKGGRSEGAPLTAIEAMAAQVPVVAARSGGLGELPVGVATIVAPGDPSALARAMARVLCDRPYRDDLITRAARFATSRDWSTIGHSIINFAMNG